MQAELVTVIIPVYNGERYLRDALESVTRQTYRNLQVMVINDGSTDGSSAIIASYGNRVSAVEQPNRGVSAARNAGLQLAQGEFIAFLDQDDRWYPDKIAKQVELFQRDPSLGLVHTDVRWLDEVSGQYVAPLNPSSGRAALSGRVFDVLLLGNYMVNSTVMVRRAAILQSGGLDESLAGNSCQDYDLWLRIARNWAFGYVPEPLADYRLHPGQGLWDFRKRLADELRVLERARSAFGLPLTGRLKQRIGQLHEELGVAHLDVSDRQSARREFLRALRRGPTPRRALLYIATFLSNGSVRRLRACMSCVRRVIGQRPAANLPAWARGNQ